MQYLSTLTYIPAASRFMVSGINRAISRYYVFGLAYEASHDWNKIAGTAV